MQNQTEKWEEELAILLRTISAKYDKWTYAMNLYSPIEDFISTLLQSTRREAIESVLPKEIEINKSLTECFTDEAFRLGQKYENNDIRQQIIQTAKSKWNINL